MSRWMVYGATGYTGRLIAKEAVRVGQRPTLAGRSREKVEPLARELDLPYVVAPLDDPRALRAAVEGHALVFNAAGPFRRTAEPMVDACLDARAHYLDITGEIPSIEAVFSRDADARARGVLLLPAAGFDVIPTDCLGAHVASKVGEPTSLEIGIAAIGRPSAGTLKSSLEILSGGGLVRRGGKLVPSRIGSIAKTIRFSNRERPCIAFPAAELATSYRTTKAADITVYMARTGPLKSVLPFLPVLTRILRASAVRGAAGRIIDLLRTGPGEAYLARGHSRVWARAANARGESAEAWLETMEGYRFTAVGGVAAVAQILGSSARPVGAQTPALALGPDFVLGLPDTRRLDHL